MIAYIEELWLCHYFHAFDVADSTDWSFSSIYAPINRSFACVRVMPSVIISAFDWGCPTLLQTWPHLFHDRLEAALLVTNGILVWSMYLYNNERVKVWVLWSSSIDSRWVPLAMASLVCRRGGLYQKLYPSLFVSYECTPCAGWTGWDTGNQFEDLGSHQCLSYPSVEGVLHPAHCSSGCNQRSQG